jgi:asparagine synthase (glutamine-hydrolysing)
MSGFAGIVRSDEGTPDAPLLQQMAERLAFRGPDATQVWTRPGAGFCFTLLRTGPSPQAPTQPCSLDGRLWLLGDVRLDGREELLAELEQNGGEQVSPNTTNEELILRAWRQWSEKSLEKLCGNFSFALWDAQTKQLWCLRDLLGVRPFFYAHVARQVIFSNTLDVLRLSADVSADLDPQFIGDFLLQSWCPDAERSVFRDIRRLPAGHLLTFSEGHVRVCRYASLPIEEPLLLKREEEYLEQFRAHLERAVRDRVPHGPTAVFMSGGLDSTSIAATAKRVHARRSEPPCLRAFTVDSTPLFEDQEGAFATLAAQHIGIPLQILHTAPWLPFARWDELGVRAPEPTAEPFFAMHLEHYRRAGQHARVALTGDGGDDVLTGRAWPHLVYLFRGGRIGNIAAIFGGYVLRHGTLPPLRVGLRARLRRWLGHREESPAYPAWLEPSFEKQFHLRDRWRELQQPPKAEHPLHSDGYASLTGSFWPSIYENEDAGWTGAAVETRAPLLDQRLLRFLLRLPPVPWCMNKHLLREAMRGLLPEEVRLRRKTPLHGDPLLAHAKSNGWKPALANGSCDRLSMFVNCRLFSATSCPVTGLSLWSETRPFALDLWLKGVENNGAILYSRNGGT